MNIFEYLFSAASMISICYRVAQYTPEYFVVTSKYCRTWLVQYPSHQEKSTLAIHNACKITVQMEARLQKPSAIEHFSSAQQVLLAPCAIPSFLALDSNACMYVRLLSAVYKMTC